MVVSAEAGGGCPCAALLPLHRLPLQRAGRPKPEQNAQRHAAPLAGTDSSSAGRGQPNGLGASSPGMPAPHPGEGQHGATAGLAERGHRHRAAQSHVPAARPGPCHAAREAAGWMATGGWEERAVHPVAQLADHGNNCTKDTSKGRVRDPSPCPRSPPQPLDPVKHTQQFPRSHM